MQISVKLELACPANKKINQNFYPTHQNLGWQPLQSFCPLKGYFIFQILSEQYIDEAKF